MSQHWRFCAAQSRTIDTFKNTQCCTIDTFRKTHSCTIETFRKTYLETLTLLRRLNLAQLTLSQTLSVQTFQHFYHISSWKWFKIEPLLKNSSKSEQWAKSGTWCLKFEKKIFKIVQKCSKKHKTAKNEARQLHWMKIV